MRTDSACKRQLLKIRLKVVCYIEELAEMDSEEASAQKVCFKLKTNSPLQYFVQTVPTHMLTALHLRFLSPSREMSVEILTFYLLTFSNVPPQPFIIPTIRPILITHLIVCGTSNGLLIKHVGVPNLHRGNLQQSQINRNILR